MLGIYFIPNVLEVHKIEVGCACPQGCVSLLHDVHMLCLTKPRIVWKAYLPPFRYILLVSTEYRDVGVNNVMLCTPCFSLKKINKEGAFQYTQFSGYWCICTVFTYNICLILAHCKMYSILLVTIFLVFFFGSCHELWLCKTKARLPTDNNSFGKKQWCMTSSEANVRIAEIPQHVWQWFAAVQGTHWCFSGTNLNQQCLWYIMPNVPNIIHNDSLFTDGWRLSMIYVFMQRLPMGVVPLNLFTQICM